MEVEETMGGHILKSQSEELMQKAARAALTLFMKNANATLKRGYRPVAGDHHRWKRRSDEQGKSQDADIGGHYKA